MDPHGMFTAEHVFRTDDLLDLSNDDLFSSNSAADVSLTSSSAHQQPPLPTLSPDISSSSSSSSCCFPAAISTSTYLLAEDLSFPLSDDVEELEWLSRFVEDSFSDIPTNSIAGTPAVRPDNTCTCELQTKRLNQAGKPKDDSKDSTRAEAEVVVGRRCTHCASEKTPQWRTGPRGPKTLCNACGVRYKSGRLVPEYRPAASPTFVLNQHSNSHRKVMELRRQKELRQQQQQQQQQQHDFQVF